MKSLLVALMLIGTCNAFAVEFDIHATDDKPIVVHIIKHVEDLANKSTVYFDSSERRRLVSMPNGSYLNIQYFNSVGVQVKTNEYYYDQDKMKLLLDSATEKCPLKIEIDRSSIQILKMSASCDVLALAENQDDQA